jgi:MinD-like ATPase involved in chromosome partitioning or flagellar assembly
MSKFKKVITFFNTKGGTGKSLLSYLVYKHFKDDYFITNTDFIKSIDDDEILHITGFDNKEILKQFQDNLMNKNAIIDTRGTLIEKDTNNIITFFLKKSNLIVIPAYADVLNLRQTYVVLKNLQPLKKDILLVFNRYNEEQDEVMNEFLKFLKEKNINIKDYTKVKNYKSFVKCIEDKDYYLRGNNKFLNYVLRNAYNDIATLHNKIQSIINEK